MEVVDESRRDRQPLLCVLTREMRTRQTREQGVDWVVARDILLFSLGHNDVAGSFDASRQMNARGELVASKVSGER